MTIRKITIWKLVFLLFLFQMALIYNLRESIMSSVISYFDEIIEIICLIYIAYSVVSKRELGKIEKTICHILVILDAIGIVSSIANTKIELFPKIVDALNCNKFIVIMIATIFYAKKSKTVCELLPSLNNVIKFISYSLTLLSATNFIFNLFPTHGYRLFMPVQKLFFEHPNDLAYVGLICAIVLLYNSRYYKNDLCLISLTFLVITTMRIRHIAMMIVIWVIYFYFIKMKMKSKILIVLLIGIVALLIGYDQISYYYGNTSETRTIVTSTSFKLANEYFPIGLGFASYGTNMARQYYSPVYIDLGFTRIWGLNYENDTFLTDQFWPAVIAQFGWIGIILFVLLLVYLYKLIAPLQKQNVYMYVTALALFIYEIFTSLGETAYYNPLAVVVFFIIGLCVAQGRDELKVG